MNRLIIIASIMLAAVPSLARSILPAQGLKYPMSAVLQADRGVQRCGFGIHVDTNTSRSLLIINKTYVYGPECPVFVKDPVDDRTPYLYQIVSSEFDGCHTRRITAEPINMLIGQIVILDHSQRRCKDLRVAPVEILEEVGGEEIGNHYYFWPKQDPVLPPPITCTAYWSGYEKVNGQCVAMGGSGCSNPFTYETIEQCNLSQN